MASFPTHISFGIATGIVATIAFLASSVTSDPGFMVLIIVAAALGSVLPDVDSDSGVPFHVAFGSIAFVAAALTFSSNYEAYPGEWERIIIRALLAAAIVWGAVGFLFKRLTRHRGMVHSLPVALLAGLVTFFAAVHFGFHDKEAFLLAVSLLLGFLGHLVLDEIYAAVNFHGHTFIPNKALGTALKLKSENTFANLVVYGAILFLMAGNVGRLANLAESLWKKLHG